MTTPPDTAAAIKEIQDRQLRDAGTMLPSTIVQDPASYLRYEWGKECHQDRAYLLAQFGKSEEERAVVQRQNDYLLAQLTAANERADRAEKRVADAAGNLAARIRQVGSAGPDGYSREEQLLSVAIKTLTDKLAAVTMEAAVLLEICVRKEYPIPDGAAPLSAAHLSEYRRLVEGQRTPETIEICEVCHQICMMFGEDGCGYTPEEDEDEWHCPLKAIRAGVKP